MATLGAARGPGVARPSVCRRARPRVRGAIADGNDGRTAAAFTAPGEAMPRPRPRSSLHHHTSSTAHTASSSTPDTAARPRSPPSSGVRPRAVRRRRRRPLLRPDPQVARDADDAGEQRRPHPRALSVREMFILTDLLRSGNCHLDFLAVLHPQLGRHLVAADGDTIDPWRRVISEPTLATRNAFSLTECIHER